MRRLQTFSDIIDRWGGVLDLSEDRRGPPVKNPGVMQLAGDLGYPYNVVAQWRETEKIPSRYWQRIIAAARRRNFHDVSFDTLARISAEKPDGRTRAVDLPLDMKLPPKSQQKAAHSREHRRRTVGRATRTGRATKPQRRRRAA